MLKLLQSLSVGSVYGHSAWGTLVLLAFAHAMAVDRVEIVSPPTPASARVLEELRRDVGAFVLELQYVGPQPSKCRSLLLKAEELPRDEAGREQYLLTADECLKLLESLAAEGFIDAGLANRYKLIPLPKEPYYRITLKVGDQQFHTFEIFDRLLLKLMLQVRAALPAEGGAANAINDCIQGVGQSIGERFYPVGEVKRQR